MNKKDIEFEEMIWDAYSQNENYDRIRFQLKRAKKIMSDSHKSFRDLPTKDQYDYCITIGIIVNQSTTKDLRQLSLGSRNKNEVFKYSLLEGFVEPSPFVITSVIKIENSK